MSEEIELIARVRARTGTSLVRRLRKEGDVPAILYGGNKENLSIAINHDVLFHSLEREDFSSQVITINTDGNKEQAILRDVQRHPHKINIMHADFMRIDKNKPIQMSLPIHFIGEEECAGVRLGGGLISHLMNEVEITCLPKDLPESIELDVTELKLGESLYLSDIKLPEDVQFTAFTHGDIEEHNNAIVSVQAPRVEAEVDEDEESAETEVVASDAESEDESEDN